MKKIISVRHHAGSTRNAWVINWAKGIAKAACSVVTNYASILDMRPEALAEKVAAAKSLSSEVTGSHFVITGAASVLHGMAQNGTACMMRAMTVLGCGPDTYTGQLLLSVTTFAKLAVAPPALALTVLYDTFHVDMLHTASELHQSTGSAPLSSVQHHALHEALTFLEALAVSPQSRQAFLSNVTSLGETLDNMTRFPGASAIHLSEDEQTLAYQYERELRAEVMRAQEIIHATRKSPPAPHSISYGDIQQFCKKHGLICQPQNPYLRASDPVRVVLFPVKFPNSELPGPRLISSELESLLNRFADAVPANTTHTLMVEPISDTSADLYAPPDVQHNQILFSLWKAGLHVPDLPHYEFAVSDINETLPSPEWMATVGRFQAINDQSLKSIFESVHKLYALGLQEFPHVAAFSVCKGLAMDAEYSTGMPGSRRTQHLSELVEAQVARRDGNGLVVLLRSGFESRQYPTVQAMPSRAGVDVTIWAKDDPGPLNPEEGFVLSSHKILSALSDRFHYKMLNICQRIEIRLTTIAQRKALLSHGHDLAPEHLSQLGHFLFNQYEIIQLYLESELQKIHSK